MNAAETHKEQRSTMLVTVAKYLIEVEDKYSEGHQLTLIEANILNELWLSKLLYKLRRWCARNEGISATEIQQEAKRLQETILLDYDTEFDPVANEALEISKEKIITKLAAEGLPAPNNLDLHAMELSASPDIIELAKARVKARFKAGLEIAGAN